MIPLTVPLHLKCLLNIGVSRSTVSDIWSWKSTLLQLPTAHSLFLQHVELLQLLFKSGFQKGIDQQKIVNSYIVPLHENLSPWRYQTCLFDHQFNLLFLVCSPMLSNFFLHPYHKILSWWSIAFSTTLPYTFLNVKAKCF